MGKFRMLKRMSLAAVLLFALAPAVFSAPGSITLVNGFDKKSLSIRWVGVGRNVSQAVVQAIDGLESDLESEIFNRCSKISEKYSGGDLQAFLKGISDNMSVIKRDMIRKSKCIADYETESGESVVWYSLDAGAFESIFDKYIAKFEDDTDAMKVYTQRIRSINRFFRNKYDFSDEVQVRVI